MFYLKNGVSLQRLQACMIIAVYVLSEYFNHIERDFVITSGIEGQHKPQSLHYVGKAFDFRSRDLTKEQRQALKIHIPLHLNAFYQLIEESDHFHIEYDDRTQFTNLPPMI